MNPKNWDRIDPEKVYDEMNEAAEDYSASQHIADLAEAAADFAFDRAFLALRDQPGSVERKKSDARSCPEHQVALRAYIDAKRVALKDKLHWTAILTRLEFIRTLETSLRAQAQHINRERG